MNSGDPDEERTLQVWIITVWFLGTLFLVGALLFPPDPGHLFFPCAAACFIVAAVARQIKTRLRTLSQRISELEEERLEEKSTAKDWRKEYCQNKGGP